MERHLQCAEEQASPANLTKYCACHAKWLSCLIFVTYGTSFTMRGATGITLQPHQILRLPRKRALQNLSEILRERLKRQFQCAADSTMIRTWSDHELVISHPPVRRGYFSRFGDAFYIENCNISRSGYLSKFHQILRLPRKLTLQDHQILRLPRKMTLMIDVRHTWHVIYNARSNRSHPPTSPNAAPATQNDSHHLSSWHMKRYLQCAEEQASPANLTKYCACHAKWLSWLIFVTYETLFTMRKATGITLQPHQILRLPRKSTPKIKEKFAENSWSVTSNAGSIRTWSDHELVISHPPVRRGYFSRFGDAFCMENYNISRSGYLPRFHRILRLPQKMTLQDHQILRLPRKVPLQDHEILRLPRKVTLQDHQILRLPRKVTLICDSTELLLNCYWTELLLSCYWTVTELLYWTVTQLLLNCYWAVTELLLNCYWTITELSCYWTVTELLLHCYWTVTELLLSCYWAVTELLLTCYWTVTELLLNCYWAVTELLLNRYWYWTELLLNCYWTELLLNRYWYWTELLLSCYWTVTELLLSCYWTVTELLLNCYWTVTELLLSCYWTITELSCYWTVSELLLHCYWTVTELLLSCYWAVTELLLSCYWTVTELVLNCYWTVTDIEPSCYWTVTDTEPSCYWTVTELSCYCIFKSS